MANVKISELSSASAAAATNLLEISEDAGAGTYVSKKVTGTQLAAFTNAQTWAGTVVAGQYGGTGVANTGKTVTLAGNLVTSGAYTVTFTLTNTTGVTLPTTGTLATLAGSETFTNKTLTNPTVTNYVETVYTPSAGSAFTVDLANGTIQKLTTNNNATITLPSSVSGKSYLIVVAYGGTHTVTWAGGSTIKWAGGAAPTATSSNGKFDAYAFWCDGTNTYGSDAGRNY